MESALLCANWSRTDQSVACPEQGTKACAACHLVLYCSKECQSAYWPIHKLDCKSDLRKPKWRPSWMIEKRTPQFVSYDCEAQNESFYDGQKNMWGNVPALDLLRLKDNEGLGIFASVDLRDVIETIASLPDEYRGHIHFDINDSNETAVARNLMMLLLALCMLHLWYSAFLPDELMESIRNTIFPAIQTALDSGTEGGNWSKGNVTLRAELSTSDLNNILASLTETPASFADAVVQRKNVTFAESSKDFRDRAYVSFPQSRRLAQQKYWKEGLLLPFGASTKDFKNPNSTLFEDKSWVLREYADPFSGWNIKEVLQPTYPAKEDVYGQLYLHVKQRLLKFCERLDTLRLSITLFRATSMFLPKAIFEARKDIQLYDRIEVSNLADSRCWGPLNVLRIFGQLLKPKEENPNATILMLFVNATKEGPKPQGRDVILQSKPMRKAREVLSFDQGPNRDENYDNPNFIRMMFASSLFIDRSTPFRRFVNSTSLEVIASRLGLEMKDKHTIVAKWPTRLKKNFTQSEFEMANSSTHRGSERYVEMRRAL
ncbi:hypothetical protein AJ79_04221 [Helicocarpus griseus UAMH5409]|uniref:MYND-type domain-containing protein n=1 Tax=Helicocarpus griseus UAMH5409 TaxID=1447875 RepID=A0A2B7XVG3_9EURO|nr:hypothetical protein AJ79_04221 [Helicocarpus griseus UAMH5409]